jgi:hypothetical protein
MDEILIRFSFVFDKWMTESACRPPRGFWCLNDKMIKEQMIFAKCETGKCLINYIEIIRY